MKIAFVYPTVPPAINGIGDYTIRMSVELIARGHEVIVLCARPGAESRQIAAEARIELADVWPDGDMSRLDGLLTAVTSYAPDAVVVEFEQFSYGRRGFNPRFSSVLEHIARRTPAATRVLLLHEAQVGVENLKTLVMLSYQRPQLLRLARSAEHILMSTDAWAPLLPRRARERAEVAPMPSNLPYTPPCPAPANSEPVRVGVFGSLDDRRYPYLLAALRALETANAEFSYVGPHRARMESLLDAVPRLSVSVRDPLPSREASEFISTQDLMLAPFAEGITSRRTSVAAALLMGRTVLTTLGRATDTASSHAIAQGAMVATPADDPAAFGSAVTPLLQDPERRARIGEAGARYYRQYLDIGIGANAIERAAQCRKRR